jgi:hypothetical protein
VGPLAPPWNRSLGYPLAPLQRGGNKSLGTSSASSGRPRGSIGEVEQSPSRVGPLAPPWNRSLGYPLAPLQRGGNKSLGTSSASSGRPRGSIGEVEQSPSRVGPLAPPCGDQGCTPEREQLAQSVAPRSGVGKRSAAALTTA